MDTIDYTPPPRPDGVPDDAVPAVLWFGPEDEHRITTIYYPKGTGRRSSEGLVDLGVPVPPYQPAPDPADSPTEPLVHRRKSLMGDRWAWCDASITDHLTGDQENVTCPACIEKVERFRAQRDAGRHTSTAAIVAAAESFPDLDVTHFAPPVTAGERTGPLGLSEAHTREIATNPNIAIKAACRAAVAEWDAQPEPAETLTLGKRQEMIKRALKSLDDLREWMDELARPIEAATRPDPDTITVNLPAADVREWADESAVANSPKADRFLTACRDALAAAGLPQEPTATRPRPTLEEQRAHLDEGSCGCHDSWDQCPCAEGGHPADGSCGCCPLGTGLCGPLPQEPTEPETQR